MKPIIRELRPYFCEPCSLHDRRTVRWADQTPTTPCQHFGTEPTSCKRMGWKRRTWYCVLCRRLGRTVTIQSETPPARGSCAEFPATHDLWHETDESAFALRHTPMGVEEAVSA